jgi:hypothetical protein
MAQDRYTKLELVLRGTLREHFAEKLSQAKQRATVVPGFEIPRAGSVDLILAPKKSTVIAVTQRSDYVAAYKHSVGQLVGVLAHYHQMSDRELREALRAAQAKPEIEEIKQPAFDPLKVSKRLAEDAKAGEVTLALVTEVPEVPQQAFELEAAFTPVSVLLETWLPTPVRKRKLCAGVEFYAVDASATPPTIAELRKAIEPMLKQVKP